MGYQRSIIKKTRFFAEIEEQHVSQYKAAGDPTATLLQIEILIQLTEAYNIYSAMQTGPNEWIKECLGGGVPSEIVEERYRDRS